MPKIIKMESDEAKQLRLPSLRHYGCGLLGRQSYVCQGPRLQEATQNAPLHSGSPEVLPGDNYNPALGPFHQRTASGHCCASDQPKCQPCNGRLPSPQENVPPCKQSKGRVPSLAWVSETWFPRKGSRARLETSGRTLWLWWVSRETKLSPDIGSGRGWARMRQSSQCPAE